MSLLELINQNRSFLFKFETGHFFLIIPGKYKSKCRLGYKFPIPHVMQTFTLCEKHTVHKHPSRLYCSTQVARASRKSRRLTDNERFETVVLTSKLHYWWNEQEKSVILLTDSQNKNTKINICIVTYRGPDVDFECYDSRLLSIAN